ncbi:MAG: RDD family protein [Thiohalocapsa sp.]|nr:RDD family protein [Thiohalocapsa sp.]
MEASARQPDPADIARARVAGLMRRLATMLYDLTLVFGVVVVAAAVFIIPYQLLSGQQQIDGVIQILFQVYLLAVIAYYYLYFWMRGRQTLGMRAWRTILVRDDGGELTATDALRRLAFAVITLAPVGIGLFWVLFDRDGLSWYDRLSRTRPVLLAAPRKKG